ncbi:hypothetical protein Taro_021598 [Colocasia esculenta]|uniref:Uncharacterized protein n=1 Tax=Colocasia esculenta TaxID=4460 RepID=A0A843V8Q0_COLES|nr:hypothetical protein [Colocasia esculenta]
MKIFKMGRCKELPDGNEQWVDEESRSRYERMIQRMTPSLDSESGSTLISVEETFVSVIGKDRFGHVRRQSGHAPHLIWNKRMVELLHPSVVDKEHGRHPYNTGAGDGAVAHTSSRDAKTRF